MRALSERLPEPDSDAETNLSLEAFTTLVALCERLRPPYERPSAREIALGLDKWLVDEDDGWRYDALPPDLEAVERGMRALDIEAGLPFAYLSSEAADALIRRLQKERSPSEVWNGVPPARLFEEILGHLAIFVYSRPWAQDAIGYVGYADGRGWHRIGPNEIEEWEL